MSGSGFLAKMLLKGRFAGMGSDGQAYFSCFEYFLEVYVSLIPPVCKVDSCSMAQVTPVPGVGCQGSGDGIL